MMIKILLPFVFVCTFITTTYSQTITAADSVLAIAEKMPEFKGGQDAFYNYLINNLAWPDVSADKVYEAKITLGFIVTKDGKITKPRVVKGGHPKLDAEALRVISGMPNWNNGVNKGRAVNVFVNIPLTYKNNARPKEEAPVEVPIKKPVKKAPVKKKKK
jgi:TonB family protein